MQLGADEMGFPLDSTEFTSRPWRGNAAFAQGRHAAFVLPVDPPRQSARRPFEHRRSATFATSDVAVVVPVGGAGAHGSDVLSRISPWIAHHVGAVIVTVDAALDPAANAAVRRVVRSHPQIPMEVVPVGCSPHGELAAFALAAQRGLRIVVVVSASRRTDPESVGRLLRPLLTGRADVVHVEPGRWLRRATGDYGCRLDRVGLERLRATRSASRLVTDVVALATAHRLRIETVVPRRPRARP